MPYTEEELNDLRAKVLANRSARERGEPEPHPINSETLRAVVDQLQTGRVAAAFSTAAKKGGDAIDPSDATLTGW